MKKLLLIVALFIAPMVVKGAELSTVVSDLTKFINIVEKEKKDWLTFTKDFHDAKFDLMIKHHNEIFELKKKFLDEFKSNGANVADLLSRELEEMIKLHDKQTAEWVALWDKFKAKAQELGTENQKEVDTFKKGYSTAAGKMATETPKKGILTDLFGSSSES